MFVPVDKRSKKEQRAFYSAQRKTWGNVSPTTKVIPNKKKDYVVSFDDFS